MRVPSLCWLRFVRSVGGFETVAARPAQPATRLISRYSSQPRQNPKTALSRAATRANPMATWPSRVTPVRKPTRADQREAEADGLGEPRRRRVLELVGRREPRPDERPEQPRVRRVLHAAARRRSRTARPGRRQHAADGPGSSRTTTRTTAVMPAVNCGRAGRCRRRSALVVRLQWWSWLSWVVGQAGGRARRTTTPRGSVTEDQNGAASSGESTQRRAHAAVVHCAALGQQGREHPSRVGVGRGATQRNSSISNSDGTASSRISRRQSTVAGIRRRPGRGSPRTGSRTPRGRTPARPAPGPAAQLVRGAGRPRAPTATQAAGLGQRGLARAAARSRPPRRPGWRRGSRPASARAPAGRRTGRTASWTAPRRRRRTASSRTTSTSPLPSTSGSRS